jgi:hypothetical protein
MATPLKAVTPTELEVATGVVPEDVVGIVTYLKSKA